MNEISTQTEVTMTSTELHSVIYQATGKYKEIFNFHKKVRQVLEKHHDSILECAQKSSNGHVEHYNLTELQANMVMASIDLNHLELITKVFLKVKDELQQPKLPNFSDPVVAARAWADAEEARVKEQVKVGILEHKLNPYTGLRKGYYYLNEIHKDQHWKSCPTTIRELLSIYGFADIILSTNGHKAKYNLHPVLQAMADIVRQSTPVGDKTLKYCGVSYIWFK